MRSGNAIKALVAVLGVALFAACGNIPAPENWAADPEGAAYDTRGCWSNVRVASGVPKQDDLEFSGELIAVSRDSLYLSMPDRLRVVPWSSITRADVVLYDSHPGNVGGIIALGTLCTLANGFALVFTAPAWLITGAGAVGSLNDAAVLRYNSEAVDPLAFAGYARFPQGLPPGIDRKRLRLPGISTKDFDKIKKQNEERRGTYPQKPD